MGAVRMSVLTADKNITIIHSTLNKYSILKIKVFIGIDGSTKNL